MAVAIKKTKLDHDLDQILEGSEIIQGVFVSLREIFLNYACIDNSSTHLDDFLRDLGVARVSRGDLFKIVKQFAFETRDRI